MSKKKRFLKSVVIALAYSAWVMTAFLGVQFLAAGILGALVSLGVNFEGVNQAVFSAALGIVVYSLTLFAAIGLPYYVIRRRTTLKELGLQRFLEWKDFIWLIVGLIAYIITTVVVTSLARVLLPFIDFQEVQETGYESIATSGEYFIAFMGIVVIAPIAEEILFRGYLFGKLQSKGVKTWIAVIITSLLFAIAHFQGNVGVDVFALSIVLCLLRVYSGSIWPSIMLHMAKNGVAFYLLFINPSILSTIGG